jgi:hypothetical protein
MLELLQSSCCDLGPYSSKIQVISRPAGWRYQSISMMRLRPRNFHFTLDDRMMVGRERLQNAWEIGRKAWTLYSFASRPLNLVSGEQDTVCTERVSELGVGMLRWLVAGFLPRRPTFGSCWICGGQSNNGEGFLQFSCQSFQRLLHIHHPSSGGGTTGEIVAYVPSGLSFTPPQETKKLKN